MKKLGIILGILLFPTVVLASPFLTCDCTPAVDKVTSFSLQFVSPTWIDTPAVQSCLTNVCTGDSKTICYDLGTLPNGPFSVKGIAKNIWGQSAESLPLSGTKSLPSSPLLLRIIN